MTAKEVNELEQSINKFRRYSEIPTKFIQEVEKHFSAFGYLMSILESKKEEENYL